MYWRSHSFCDLTWEAQLLLFQLLLLLTCHDLLIMFLTLAKLTLCCLALLLCTVRPHMTATRVGKTVFF